MDSSNHSRRNNIVITGISPSIKANELEPIAIKILAAVNVDVSTKEIHAVHRLHMDDEKSMPTIISFTNRKSVEAALAHRKLLKDLDMESIGLNRKTSLYINKNVCQKTPWLDVLRSTEFEKD